MEMQIAAQHIKYSFVAALLCRLKGAHTEMLSLHPDTNCHAASPQLASETAHCVACVDERLSTSQQHYARLASAC